MRRDRLSGLRDSETGGQLPRGACQAEPRRQDRLPHHRLPRVLRAGPDGRHRPGEDLLPAGRACRRRGDHRQDPPEGGGHRPALLRRSRHRREGGPRGRRPVLQEADAPRLRHEQQGRSGEPGGLPRHRRLQRPGEGPHRDEARSDHPGGHQGEPPGPGRRRIPRRLEVGCDAEGQGRSQVRHLQRRRRRSRRLHGPEPPGGEPPSGPRGDDHRRLRDRLEPGLHLRPERIPARDQEHHARDQAGPRSGAPRGEHPRDRASPST